MHGIHCLRGTCRQNILPWHSKRCCMTQTSPWDLMQCTLQVLRELFRVIANLLQLSLKGCGDWPRFLHNVRKHVIPKERGFREQNLISLTLTLGNVMEKVTLKITSNYFKIVFGSSQHKFTTEEIMSNESDSFLWGASHWMMGHQWTGSQTTRSRWSASAGGHQTRCTPKTHSPSDFLSLCKMWHG